MADNNPNLPGGAPKPPEGSKIQPKKETVRINLPPKPTAAPTIKIPSPSAINAAAPAAAAPAVVTAAAAPAASAAAPAAQRAIPVSAAAPASATRPAAAPAMARAPIVVGVGKVEMGLAIGAAVVMAVVAVRVFMLLSLFPS